MSGAGTWEEVACCFCGLTLPEASAALLVIYSASDREESQTLYAHRRCLSQRLHPGIPRHPDLTSQDRPNIKQDV